MAKGEEIIVSAYPDPKRYVEYIVNTGETHRPGMCVQEDPTQDTQGGRFVAGIYNADADGANPKGRYIIVLPNRFLGHTSAAGTYAAGERAFGYVPRHGEEFNLLLGDVSGTGDAHTAGEILILDDTTGEFVATTGSPEQEVAMLMEDVDAPTADTLAWCTWQGP